MVIYATDMSPSPSPPRSRNPSPFSKQASTSSPEQQAPPTTFPLFALLPLELRLQIYHEALLLHPRVLSINPTSTSSLSCTSPHPALLSLNREARLEALQSYHLILDLEGERGFYYNPLLDTIHLTSSTKYAAAEASTTSTPQDEWLLWLSQISSSLPQHLGVYSLALRGVSTLPPSSSFLSSGGNKVREMLMLVGPGAHRTGASTYCGVGVGFMRKMMCREMERALEVMDDAGGFESGRVPSLVPLVGGSEDEVQERVLEERGDGLLII